jgi:hypothetical protein
MKIGDITIMDGIEVWRKNQTNYFLHIPCKSCGKLRWINRSTLSRPNYQGKCKKCSGNHAKPPRYNGRFLTSEGYVMVQLKPDNFFFQMTEKNGYVKEHRLIMAKWLGRCLQSWEVVHHKNGERDDNRIRNLSLQTSSDHATIHNYLRALKLNAIDPSSKLAV